MAQRDNIIDLTSSPTGYSTPNVVTPTVSNYNSYSLVLNFWDDDGSSANENEGIPPPVTSHTIYGPRSLRLVLIYLTGEQDRFRGVSETRGQHWKNSWSASIRSIINYWHVYGEQPRWAGSIETYLFGVGPSISLGIRAFLERNHLDEGNVAIGASRSNVDIVRMLKHERHYRSARAIEQWSDDCGVNYRISTRKIFKSASRGISLEEVISNFLITTI